MGDGDQPVLSSFHLFLTDKAAWCNFSCLYSLLVDRTVLSRLFFLTEIWHFTDAMFFTPGPKYGISIWLQSILTSLNMNTDVELNIKNTVKIGYIADNSGFLNMFSTCKKPIYVNINICDLHSFYLKPGFGLQDFPASLQTWISGFDSWKQIWEAGGWNISVQFWHSSESCACMWGKMGLDNSQTLCSIQALSRGCFSIQLDWEKSREIMDWGNTVLQLSLRWWDDGSPN